MKSHEEFFQKCAVLFRNGAVFFSTALIVRSLIAVSSRFTEQYGDGYEPLFFLFLAGFLVLAAALCFMGEVRTTEDAKPDPVGALFLLLFVLLPGDGPVLVTGLSLLTAGIALIRIPRLFRDVPPSAVMAGCAGAGIPGALFQPAELFILLLTVLFLLSLFPRKLRIPAALFASLMLAVRLFLPVFPAGESTSGEDGQKKIPDSETLQYLYHLTLLACSEAGEVPQTYQCVTKEGGTIGSPGRLSLAVLVENTGGQDPKQFLESDVLRRETLSGTSHEESASAPSSNGETSSDKNVAADPGCVFLYDPGRPVNFRTNYRCTENYFQRIKESLPGNAIAGFLLPEGPGTCAAETLSALRNTCPNTALFFFPKPMVLASAERPLSRDPEELDRRAVQGHVYEKLFTPYHILSLALPHFQDPVAVSSLLDAASRAKPNRTDRLISFREPAAKKEIWFAEAVKYALPLTGIVFLLYAVLRYFTSWKPVRKSSFRAAEAGFLFAGSAFFLAVPFLRSVEPDPSKWFPVCLSVTALGTAWAFSYTKGPRSTKLIPRVILPLLSLAGLVFFEPHEVWSLFFAAIFMGTAWKNALADAATPLTNGPAESGAVFPLSAVVLGSAAALLLLPPLFFTPGGLYGGAALLAAILVTRHPAVVSR